jgi:hypothetical protein
MPHHPHAEDNVHMTAPWWQAGVIYEICPHSFHEMNGDGIGDLKGIERRRRRNREPQRLWRAFSR